MDLKHHWEVIIDNETVAYSGFSKASAQKVLGAAILEQGHRSIRVYRDQLAYKRIIVIDAYELDKQSGWLDEQQYLDIQHSALLMKREK